MKYAVLSALLLLAACDQNVHYTTAAPLDDISVSSLEGARQ